MKGTRSQWQREARRRWRKHGPIQGDGRYALVRNCRDFDVILCETIEEANEKTEWSCGGGCYRLLPGAHQIVDLSSVSI